MAEAQRLVAQNNHLDTLGKHQDSLRDTLLAEAQKLVAHAANSPENIQQAKARAESAIRGAGGGAGRRTRVRTLKFNFERKLTFKV